MKNPFFKISLSLIFCIIAVSCKKEDINGNPAPAAAGRTVRFQLYTDQDFSNDNHIINFTVFVKRGNVNIFDSTTNNILYDSTFASMQIKDIPDFAHKITIEKQIANYDNVDLTAGFIYEIENVGYSWHIDTSRAGNPLKVIDYNFR